jgi:hypothetical protein
MRVVRKSFNSDIDQTPETNILRTKTLKKLSISQLPHDVIISTMTFVCEIDTCFNCHNIAKYITLTLDGILAVSYGKNCDPETNRSILKSVTGVGKKKNKKMFL